jgi:hypothetical protein
VLVGEPVEELEERVGDGLPDEQACPRQADLAGVVVLARRLAGGGLEVGVREHEQRTLPAEFAREGDDVACRRLTDVDGRLGRPCERDAPNARLPRQGGAHLLADPLDDIEDSQREARLRDEVAEQ